MGYNDFHKGFINHDKEQRQKVVLKKNYGARSIEDIIQDKYKKRNDLSSKEIEKPHRETTDYQKNIQAQRNIRFLGK